MAGYKARLDEALAEYQDQLRNNQAEHADRSRATLAKLRGRLFWISLITFVATMAGGYWLVRVGLAPLRRLSDAVSQVSEKDFRLPVDEQHLPVELQPIVERLNQTLAMLKRAFAREKQAAADISHELRTPVTALLTTTEVALRKPRSPEEYRELLEDCRLSGQQMSQLVERLLALARLDAGVDTLRPRQVDVAGLAKQCADLVRPLAEARALRLGVQTQRGQKGGEVVTKRMEDGGSKIEDGEAMVPSSILHPPSSILHPPSSPQSTTSPPHHLTTSPPLFVNTDPDKLREILNNLLHNAIEYNRAGGSVDVEIERQNGYLLVAVRDTGIGIAPEKRQHIFERFYRGDPSRQADGLHAGLGLAIVKGYVDLMGGSIAVDSVEGQGSTFRVLLPAS